MPTYVRALVLAAASLFSLSALAVPATWGGGGIAPATPSFTAASSGTLELYYTGLAGGYTNLVGVQINGVDQPLTGLNNRTSTYGQLLQLGNVNAGDVLVFFVDVTDTSLRYYTNPSLNPDQANHAWAQAYAGDPAVPAGINIAFEDLAIPGSDLNYADHSFTFRIAGAVPEPASAVMLLLGVAGLAGLRRSKQR